MSTAARGGGVCNKYRHAVMVTTSWWHLRGSLVREKRKQPWELEGLGLTPTTRQIISVAAGRTLLPPQHMFCHPQNHSGVD